MTCNENTALFAAKLWTLNSGMVYWNSLAHTLSTCRVLKINNGNFFRTQLILIQNQLPDGGYEGWGTTKYPPEAKDMLKRHNSRSVGSTVWNLSTQLQVSTKIQSIEIVKTKYLKVAQGFLNLGIHPRETTHIGTVTKLLPPTFRHIFSKVHISRCL